ncbi:ArsR/SmtB family transcription factor [Streptomyces sp. NPDC059506]|uniref:ArsR/SmtB family transcription factor n=1 Tax=unclassified Streptomyces TaxID=2593676 RepID=UPI0015F97E55|nr:helix-turn-helix domain-containing protein [Streptomyces sp. SCUT-3]QMV23004.1 helix-turn-helix domain-containing protein [Streptomyces sp. SCUT-3]
MSGQLHLSPTTPAKDAGPLGNVLGHTRTALPAGLAQPRTTTELAALRHLSPSTVSYHLALLHRAGLATRTRSGSSVYHRRSPEAGRLGLRGRPAPSGPATAGPRPAPASATETGAGPVVQLWKRM